MVEFNEQKLKELILYIASQCKEDVFFGATKLNKLLFFADFLAYERLGRPITGADYMVIEHGPAPRRLIPLREEMLEDGDICIEQRPYQTRIVASREPNLGDFSRKELAIVDYVIRVLRDIDAESVSDLTHQLPAWREARAEGMTREANSTIAYGATPVSTVLCAAAQASDSSWQLYQRGMKDLEEGRYSRLEDVKRRLGDL